eukprot:s175_g4.t1
MRGQASCLVDPGDEGRRHLRPLSPHRIRCQTEAGAQSQTHSGAARIGGSTAGGTGRCGRRCGAAQVVQIVQTLQNTVMNVFTGAAPRLSPLKHAVTARTEEMASTEPSRLHTSQKVMDLARQAEEVLKVGEWSVRKLPDNPEIAFVYLNEQEGRVEVQAPPEVIQELQDEGLRPRDGQNDDLLEEASAEPEPCPLYRRILLGAHTEVPLRMARDILEAIREDVDIFQEVQQRFSDLPDEALLSLEDDLGEELEAVALAMQPGELSEVLGTEAGMQILLRVR